MSTSYSLIHTRLNFVKSIQFFLFHSLALRSQKKTSYGLSSCFFKHKLFFELSFEEIFCKVDLVRRNPLQGSALLDILLRITSQDLEAGICLYTLRKGPPTLSSPARAHCCVSDFVTAICHLIYA